MHKIVKIFAKKCAKIAKIQKSFIREFSKASLGSRESENLQVIYSRIQQGFFCCFFAKNKLFIRENRGKKCKKFTSQIIKNFPGFKIAFFGRFSRLNNLFQQGKKSPRREVIYSSDLGKNKLRSGKNRRKNRQKSPENRRKIVAVPGAIRTLIVASLRRCCVVVAWSRWGHVGDIFATPSWRIGEKFATKNRAKIGVKNRRKKWQKK